MCGIIGYVGGKEALPLLIEGLKNLEYRGYDSSGVCLLPAAGGALQIRKEQGKIRCLEELMSKEPLPSAHVGIAHTRWATHGAPCRKNSHPHPNADHTIAVVHNGIIENYQTLRSSLIRKGYTFLHSSYCRLDGILRFILKITSCLVGRSTYPQNSYSTP